MVEFIKKDMMKTSFAHPQCKATGSCKQFYRSVFAQRNCADFFLPITV